MLGVLLLVLAASPELPFAQSSARIVAPGQTFDVTSAVAPPFLTSLVVWVAQGRLGIERPSIYASRVQPNGNVNDPEGQLRWSRPGRRLGAGDERVGGGVGVERAGASASHQA